MLANLSVAARRFASKLAPTMFTQVFHMSRAGKRRSRRVAGAIRQLPWQSIVNPYPPAEPFSADQVESIHEASLAILERMGIRVLHLDRALVEETIAEVDPGGHFFATQHTLDRYEDAFYTPLVSDWSNYETWQESGARTTAQRANTIWKQLLREYQQPELDAGIDEVLENYVARRKREISAKS